MKNRSAFLILALLMPLLAPGQTAQDDIKKNPSCALCGMDRARFGHSRMLIEFQDGTVEATCSLFCAAMILVKHWDKTPKTIRVGDYQSRELIEAEKAFWIIGGSKPGVMTSRAKWAFAKKEEAEKFRAENGGELASFDGAMKATFEDLYLDIKARHERKKR